jgi:uncharacterized protein (TIGR01777 family)
VSAARPRLVIAGGAGDLGRALALHFAPQYAVTVLSRSPRAVVGADVQRWDGETRGAWFGAVDGADVLINLAGRSVNCRYTPGNRREILESRVRSTRILGQAVAESHRPPRVWLNAASATIYRHAEDRPMDEFTGEFGAGFSVDVCRAWEAEFAAADTPHTRRVALRLAMVLARDGGVLPVLTRLTRAGLGGTMGPGTQYVSWIHERDLARTLDWLIERDDFDGAVNVGSPHPVPNRDLMEALRRAVGVRIGLPATRPMLEVGAVFLRTETELVLKSRRVVPARLLASGFTFDFPEVEGALRDLL